MLCIAVLSVGCAFVLCIMCLLCFTNVFCNVVCVLHALCLLHDVNHVYPMLCLLCVGLLWRPVDSMLCVVRVVCVVANVCNCIWLAGQMSGALCVSLVLCVVYSVCALFSAACFILGFLPCRRYVLRFVLLCLLWIVTASYYMLRILVCAASCVACIVYAAFCHVLNNGRWVV